MAYILQIVNHMVKTKSFVHKQLGNIQLHVKHVISIKKSVPRIRIVSASGLYSMDAAVLLTTFCTRFLYHT